MKKKLISLMVIGMSVLLGGCSPRNLVLHTAAGETARELPVSTAETYTGASETAVEMAVETAEEAAQSETSPPGEVTVYICGAVNQPDVYTLPEGARVNDAVQLAGGLSEDADPVCSNLARPLTDGEMIRILTLEETAAYGAADDAPETQGIGTPDGSGYASADGSGEFASMQMQGMGGISDSAGSAGEDALVHINSAGIAELKSLPGIGDARAQAIIACRERLGGFTDIEQIKEADGIGDGLFKKIRDLIAL